ncbi:MAG: hypothetical protein ACFB0B_17315 [Thermonemataceae bacterium]
MKRCQIKTGFFVLKECGAIATARCRSCKKYVCEAHIAEQGKPQDDMAVLTNTTTETGTSSLRKDVLCIECYTKMNKEKLSEKYHKGYRSSTTNDIFWYFYMRDSFYRNHHYQPFDDYDTDSFNTTSYGSDFDDDDGSASFYDS